MRCVIDEFRKIEITKYFIILTVLLLIGNMVLGFLYHNSELDSTEALKREKQSCIEARELATKYDDEYKMANYLDEQIELISYSIKHGTPYQQLSIASNFVKNGMLENVVVIIVIIIAYNLIEVERESRTWKNLIIFNKFNRNKILLRKKLATIISIVVAIALFIIMAFAFGFIRYKAWGNVQAVYSNGAVITKNYNSEIFSVIVSIIVKCFIYSEAAFCISFLSEKSRVYIIVPVILLLFEKTIYSFLCNFKWNKVLPYYHLNILENVSYHMNQEVVIALIYILIFAVLLELIGFVSVRKISD